MTAKSKYSKEDFIKFVMSSIDSVTSDKDTAKEYLKSEGLNPDLILAEGLKRLRKIQLKIESEKTKKEMISTESVKQKAIEWVENIMSNIDFSFESFVREEKLSLHNKNIENFSKEDVKNTMVQYFTLKFLEEQEKDKNKNEL